MDDGKTSLNIAKQSTALYAVGRVVCTPVIKLLFRTKYTNRYNIPKDGRYLICSNHLSYLDPVLLGLGQKRKIRFIAKSELFKNKFFAGLITRLGAFPVHRGESDSNAINVGEQILKDGGVMGIFFEGKRSRTGDFLRPRSGAVMIAFQTDTPIVPACITPEKGLVKLFRKTHISFGEPVTVKELGITEGTAREFRTASKNLMNILEELRHETTF